MKKTITALVAAGVAGLTLGACGGSGPPSAACRADFRVAAQQLTVARAALAYAEGDSIANSAQDMTVVTADNHRLAVTLRGMHALRCPAGGYAKS